MRKFARTIKKTTLSGSLTIFDTCESDYFIQWYIINKHKRNKLFSSSDDKLFLHSESECFNELDDKVFVLVGKRLIFEGLAFLGATFVQIS